jgi:hypothetical protein
MWLTKTVFTVVFGCWSIQVRLIRKIPIAAAGGILQVPLVEVKRFSCLGCSADNFAIVGLNLPLNSAISGLIGMDFLVRYRAVIDTGKAEIWIPD